MTVEKYLKLKKIRKEVSLVILPHRTIVDN